MTLPRTIQEAKRDKTYKVVPEFHCGNCDLTVQVVIRTNGKMNCATCGARIKVRDYDSRCIHLQRCPKCNYPLEEREKRLK